MMMLILLRVRGSMANNNGFWIRWLDLLTFSFTITLNYNQLQQLTINDCLRFAPFCWTTAVFSSYCDWLGSDLRIGHFFSFRCPLVNTPQQNTQLFACERRITAHLRVTNESKSKSQNYITTDGQSASLYWNKAPIWGLRPDLYYCLTVAGLLMWGALSLTRRRICRLQLLLALASAVIHIRDFPFRRLLRLAELRWRYSTQLPHAERAPLL
jgi:hypothetical protein